MSKTKIWLGVVGLGLAAMLLGRPAQAFTVDPATCGTCDGMAVDISFTFDAATLTASFTWTSTLTTNAWQGEVMDSLSLQFGGEGTANLNQSVTAAAIGPGTPTVTWTRYYDKVTGNGCSAGTFDAVCFTVLPTGAGGAGGVAENPALVMGGAGSTYTWTFDVKFSSLAIAQTQLAATTGHSIKFLSVRWNPNAKGGAGEWQTGHQLSENEAFGDDDEDLPEPGTLALLGLGLLGLGAARRRRTV